MATYVYETIPQNANEAVTQFEVQQSMHDAPLTRHPETGSPVRRIIVGGIGLIGANTGRSVAEAPAKTERKQADGSHCCGGGCGCHN